MNEEKLCVLITGAASGIGLGLSKYLLETTRHYLILSDLNGEALSQVAETLKDFGDRFECRTFDVRAQSQIDALFESNLSVDVLVNNAGIQHVAPLETFPSEKWRLVNEVLLVGPAMLTRACIAGMKARNFGRIINIGSIHSVVASAYKSAYVAAKHGLIGFSKTVALETASENITINTICPSYVKTPLVEKQIQQQAEAHGISQEEVVNSIMLAPMPKKAFIDCEEIAAAVNFLISPQAKNITGQSLVIDGGWTCQ